MSYEHQTGDSFDNTGEWLREPGTYHVIVQAINDHPSNSKGSLIDGAAFQVEYIVLAGTVDGQKNRTFEDTFFAVKPSDTEEQQQRARLKIDRFFLAASLITDADKGKAVKLNLNDALGRQLFITTVKNKKDEKYLRCYTDIYHVDDPAVKAFPRDDAALARIPASRRMIGAKPVPAKPLPTTPAPDPASL